MCIPIFLAYSKLYGMYRLYACNYIYIQTRDILHKHPHVGSVWDRFGFLILVWDEFLLDFIPLGTNACLYGIFSTRRSPSVGMGIHVASVRVVPIRELQPD